MDVKITLTDFIKKFQIGDFRISAYTNDDYINEPVIIPGSFMAFEKEFSGEADFNFLIDSSADIERGKELFRSDNFMRTTIYESGKDAWNWVWSKQNGEDGINFFVKKDFSHIVLNKNDSFAGKLMHQLGLMFAYAVMQRDACVLHGIIMEYKGRGILVLAKSGTGKSTHSRMWRDEENALIINGDRCLCRRINGQWYAYGMPWCGNSGEYINRKVPITDIVFLERGLVNQVKKMPIFDGTMRLLESIKAPNWDNTLYVKALDYCEELAKEIPMWLLHCTPDIEAVHTLKKAIFGGKDEK